MSKNPQRVNLDELSKEGSQGDYFESNRNTIESVTSSKKGLIAGGIALLGAAQAQAALIAPTFDSADAITVGTAVLGGLALIWAIKKAMAMAK